MMLRINVEEYTFGRELLLKRLRRVQRLYNIFMLSYNVIRSTYNMSFCLFIPLNLRKRSFFNWLCDKTYKTTKFVKTSWTNNIRNFFIQHLKKNLK